MNLRALLFPALLLPLAVPASAQDKPAAVARLDHVAIWVADQQKSIDWAKEVVDQARGVNPQLERMFDRLYRQRPVV